jgi:hypothetical protein
MSYACGCTATQQHGRHDAGRVMQPVSLIRPEGNNLHDFFFDASVQHLAISQTLRDTAGRWTLACASGALHWHGSGKIRNAALREPKG